MLAHARGEGDDVGAGQDREVGADILAQPMHVDVVRRLRPLVTRVDRVEEVAEVGQPRHPVQPGSVVQQVLEPVEVEVAVPQQVHEQAGVEVARSGAHDQTLQAA